MADPDPINMFRPTADFHLAPRFSPKQIEAINAILNSSGVGGVYNQNKESLFSESRGTEIRLKTLQHSNMNDVSIKAKILQAVHDFPENSTIEDAIEKLILLHKVEIGLKQEEDGQTVSLEDVENGLRQKRQFLNA